MYLKMIIVFKNATWSRCVLPVKGDFLQSGRATCHFAEKALEVEINNLMQEKLSLSSLYIDLHEARYIARKGLKVGLYINPRQNFSRRKLFTVCFIYFKIQSITFCIELHVLEKQFQSV